MPRHFMTHAIALMMSASVIIIGCSASEEGTKEKASPPPLPSATEMMNKSMADLKLQNDSLKSQIIKLEQDNRAATAHAAEIETRMNELKEKLSAPPPKMKTINVHDTYAKALVLFRSRNYQECASTLQSILDEGAPVDLQDNCHYWQGECAYAVKNFKEAVEHFEKVFTFKVSEKKDDAQIMIANCYRAMGNKSKAKAEYQKLIDKYPASPYVRRAKEKLERL